MEYFSPAVAAGEVAGAASPTTAFDLSLAGLEQAQINKSADSKTVMRII
jgi:hypothetical protein